MKSTYLFDVEGTLVGNDLSREEVTYWLQKLRKIGFVIIWSGKPVPPWLTELADDVWMKGDVPAKKMAAVDVVFDDDHELLEGFRGPEQVHARDLRSWFVSVLGDYKPDQEEGLLKFLTEEIDISRSSAIYLARRLLQLYRVEKR